MVTAVQKLLKPLLQTTYTLESNSFTLIYNISHATDMFILGTKPQFSCTQKRSDSGPNLEIVIAGYTNTGNVRVTVLTLIYNISHVTDKFIKHKTELY